jgi:hypothetical protein
MDSSTLVGSAIGVLVALVVIAILVLIFRWLWNSTMPDVFGVKELTVWQALKILILASILFGGYRVAEVPNQISDDAAPAATTAD